MATCRLRLAIVVAASLSASLSASASGREPGQGNFILNVVYDAFFGVDSANRSRKLEGLAVIGAGFARTGTASLHAALQILGFHSYHMKEVFINDHGAQWHAVFRENFVDAAANIFLTNGYDATVDTPGAIFAVELAKKFPTAKVILTTRNDDAKWLNSVKSIKKLHDTARGVPHSWIPRVRRFDDMAQDMWQGWNCSIRGPINEARCLESYHAHNARVLSDVPAGQLLHYQLGQGWQPLCDFLGVPIPNVKFPHTNDSTGMTVALALLTSVTWSCYACPILLSVFLWRVCCGYAKVKYA